MTGEAGKRDQIAEALEALRAELVALGDRVAALETAVAGGAGGAGGQSAAEPISDELAMVIGAAVAAFLGKKPKIRQIRLIRSSNWAQEGRATIQASHKLNIRHS